MNIGLNIFFSGIIIYLVIGYLNERKIGSNDRLKQENEIKYNVIQPKSEILRKYDNIIDFIFSVQDLYIYNPSAFDEFVENLESLIILFENIMIGVNRCDQYYTVADMKVNNILNSFHSLVYSIPGDKIMMDKFNRAHSRLNTITNDFLNKIYEQCNNKIINYGLDITSKLINTGPKEGNYYNKEISYEFY